MKKGNWIYCKEYNPINLDLIIVVQFFSKKNVETKHEWFTIEFFNQDETKIGSGDFLMKKDTKKYQKN